VDRRRRVRPGDSLGSPGPPWWAVLGGAVVLGIVVIALLIWCIRKHQAEATNDDTAPSGQSRRA
jgi:hypothetical protein